MVPSPILIRDNKLQMGTVEKEVINIDTSASTHQSWRVLSADEKSLKSERINDHDFIIIQFT